MACAAFPRLRCERRSGKERAAVVLVAVGVAGDRGRVIEEFEDLEDLEEVERAEIARQSAEVRLGGSGCRWRLGPR